MSILLHPRAGFALLIALIASPAPACLGHDPLPRNANPWGPDEPVAEEPISTDQEPTAGATQTGPAPLESRRSVFGDVLHLGEEPPEARSIAAIQLLYKGCSGAPRDLDRDLESTLALAEQLRERLHGGTPFAELARLHSASNTAPTGGVFGTFAPGFLIPDFDRFLFSAGMDQFSEPLVSPTGVHVLKRVERWAGARVICVVDREAAGREKMATLMARLDAGENFGELASELSEDPVTAPRAGALAVFERGRGDRLLKAAAFEAAVGEIVGPIDTPRGLYLVQRVEPDLIPAELHDNPWIDLRCILLTHDTVTPPIQAFPRSYGESQALALELIRRIGEGESMADLAREFDNDHGGAQRAGRVGWIHRQQPGLSNDWKPLWLEAPGELKGPIGLPIGHLIFRRER